MIAFKWGGIYMNLMPKVESEENYGFRILEILLIYYVIKWISIIVLTLNFGQSNTSWETDSFIPYLKVLIDSYEAWS